MRHAAAAKGLNQRFFDDALFHVEREFAGALLRCAPADAMRQAADIGDLLCLNPLALFGNRSGIMLCAF
ncbi:hypothetical protein SDC9_147927 [bioreactor metagenome]|uniref:Uncharacterized protein n=1 Tax=bioreactor metagenome TaxID=1076179 RepID=A0A645EFR2_9ZZZZ